MKKECSLDLLGIPFLETSQARMDNLTHHVGFSTICYHKEEPGIQNALGVFFCSVLCYRLTWEELCTIEGPKTQCMAHPNSLFDRLLTNVLHQKTMTSQLQNLLNKESRTNPVHLTLREDVQTTFFQQSERHGGLCRSCKSRGSEEMSGQSSE